MSKSVVQQSLLCSNLNYYMPKKKAVFEYLYILGVNYTLNADTTITGQSKTRRVDLYKGTTNHEGVFNSNPISVSISGETCDDVYARVMVRYQQLSSYIYLISTIYFSSFCAY